MGRHSVARGLGEGPSHQVLPPGGREDGPAIGPNVWMSETILNRTGGGQNGNHHREYRA